MTGLFVKLVVPATIVAAGMGGYWLGQNGGPAPLLAEIEAMLVPASSAATSPPGPVLYYRHPDGLPSYSATPKTTDDGRVFVAVTVDPTEGASTDVSTPRDQAMGAEAMPLGKRKILFYRNPMGLPDTSPMPKKDSMGMDYIPVYQDEGTDTSSITVSPGKMQRSGVRSEIASERPVVRTIRVPGNVEIDERLVAVVATRSEAFVDRVASVTTGDVIKKGDPLVWLYSPDVSSAGAQYLVALRDGGAGEAGARQRLVNLGVPVEAIEGIAKKGEVPISIAWPAPRDGVIVERKVMDGMAATSGAELFKIADLSTVWVVADVPEYELDAVAVGAAVEVGVRSLPGRSFSGRVTLIYPGVASITRTARVRIEIANRDRLLLPGMYADVAVATGAEHPVLAVPDDAILDTGEHRTVILDLGEGRFEPRDVETGRQGDGFTEILSGIVTGDRIVTSANFLIDAESNIKAALSTMSETKGQIP
ncbi:MAG: efflux RND transporter periplasmic adaptor subunit [Devosia sp.]